MSTMIKWSLFAAAIVALVGCFYWYEVRVYMARKDCCEYARKEATEKKIDQPLTYKIFYDLCLNGKGMRAEYDTKENDLTCNCQ